jgi:hypothetical protein
MVINKDDRTIILNGAIITPFQILKDKAILIRNGKLH